MKLAKWIGLSVALALTWAVLQEAWAAPLLRITKPPVQSGTSPGGTTYMTGPSWDKYAEKGQWFKKKDADVYEVREYEFYDNVHNYGGSVLDNENKRGSYLSIKGIATHLEYSSNTEHLIKGL